MRLTDLLQLTNDVSDQTVFFLTVNTKIVPLSKLKISSTACLLFPGQKPMTKAKIVHLVKSMHKRDIPLYVKNGEEKIPVYGIQITPENNSVRIT